MSLRRHAVLEYIAAHPSTPSDRLPSWRLCLTPSDPPLSTSHNPGSGMISVASLRTGRGLRIGRLLGSRAAGSVLDETLSSLQNFVILFAALRYLSVNDLGRFTLAYTGTLLVESALKSLVLEPLAIRFSAADESTLRHAGRSCVGAALVVGAAWAAGSGALALAVPASERSTVVTAGLIVPALMVQEAWRVYFFTAGRVWRAVVNDGMCLLGTLALVAVWIISGGETTPTILLGLWGVGTALGAIAGMVQSRIVPAPFQGVRWTREHWRLGSRLAGGTSIEQLSGRISLGLIGTIAGTVALGQFAAARTVLTPATTAVASTVNFAVPEAARLRARRDRRLGLFIVGLSIVLGGVVCALTALIYVTPDAVGHVIAGSNWDLAKVLLLPVALSGVALAARQGARVGLRIREDSPAIFRLSVATGLLVVAGTTAGAALGGANGAAWSFAGSHVLTTAMWWVTYQWLGRRVLVNSRQITTN